MTKGKESAEAREARRAEALRANLARRKARARALKAASDKGQAQDGPEDGEKAGR